MPLCLKNKTTKNPSSDLIVSMPSSKSFEGKLAKVAVNDTEFNVVILPPKRFPRLQRSEEIEYEIQDSIEE